MNYGDLMQLIIFVLFIGGGAVFSVINAYREQQKQKQRPEDAFEEGEDEMEFEVGQRDFQTRGTDYDRRMRERRSGTRDQEARLGSDADDIRVQAGAPASRGEPGNLTMAERIARARAKAQYNERSEVSQGEASRSGGEAPASRDTAQREADARQREAQRRRAAAERAELQRRQERERQIAAERSRRERESARAQDDAQAELAERRRQQRSRRASQGPSKRSTLTPAGGGKPAVRSQTGGPSGGPARAGSTEPVSNTEIDAHAVDAYAIRPRKQGRKNTSMNWLSRMNENDWRKAIVLKEVLDKPVSMRKPSSA